MDRSVAKESQNRYSKQAKDWGWREFVTLTSLFDLDAGFLVNDCVVFAAEVLVLREMSELKVCLAQQTLNPKSQISNLNPGRVNDCVVFAAEVLVLQEMSELKVHSSTHPKPYPKF